MCCLLAATLAVLPWCTGIAAYAWSGSPYLGLAGFAAGMLLAMVSGRSWVLYQQDRAEAMHRRDGSEDF